jgi:hypothetical protein
MKAVIQADARRKRLMPISAKPVLELLLRWLRRYNVEAMDREAGKPALVLVACRRTPRGTNGSHREIAP